ncbi:16017_t:CDS:2, partial [Acaulospora colombiana]
MEEEIVANTAAEPLTITQDVYDIAILKGHLCKLLPLLLDADKEDLEESIWSPKENNDKLKRFAVEPQFSNLYITKTKKESDKEKEDEPPSEPSSESPSEPSSESDVYEYSITQELFYNPRNVACVAVIKQGSTLDANRSIQSQIQVINLPGPSSSDTGTDVSPYEALYSYIHSAVTPYFDAYVIAKSSNLDGIVSSSVKRSDDSKSSISMAKKKIIELELALLNLQQNVEIPEITLNIHPVIQKVVEKAKRIRVSVDMVDSSIIDSGFLNKLQGDVNGWIKEIQKVTKLSRDPSNGTAIQEINFWLGMETALEDINERLKSDQIVHKYNQLMKDFPLNELLSAPDVARVKDSLHDIFDHFKKKLKLSNALLLVEAISRDLNEQLLKVLAVRRLMYMEYDEFEKVMSGAEDVFATWDEMIKEFTNVARE